MTAPSPSIRSDFRRYSNVLYTAHTARSRPVAVSRSRSGATTAMCRRRPGPSPHPTRGAEDAQARGDYLRPRWAGREERLVRFSRIRRSSAIPGGNVKRVVGPPEHDRACMQTEVMCGPEVPLLDSARVGIVYMRTMSSRRSRRAAASQSHGSLNNQSGYSSEISTTQEPGRGSR